MNIDQQIYYWNGDSQTILEGVITVEGGLMWGKGTHVTTISGSGKFRVKQSAFSTPAWPEDGYKLPFVDVKIQVGNNGILPEGDVQILYFDHGIKVGEERAPIRGKRQK